jgi:hypothetical protein
MTLITMKMMMMLLMMRIIVMVFMMDGDEGEFDDEKEKEMMMSMTLIKNMTVDHMSIVPHFQIVLMKMLYQRQTCSLKLRHNITMTMMLQ